MGHYNFAALRHRSLAFQKFDSRRIDQTPSWYSALTTVPVSQTLVRQQPIPHPVAITRTRTLPLPDATSEDSVQKYPDPQSEEKEQYTFLQSLGRRRLTKKKSRGKAKLFKPITIRYEEDQIRNQFFSDHPWELARPRVVLEQTGDDANNNGHDWSKGVVQAGKTLSGENCVQRTLWLLQNIPDITWDAAYTIARKEFYKARLKEDVERRIAPEEATHYGAKFGPNILEKSIRHEDAAYENWRRWAKREQQMRLQARAGAAAPPVRTRAEAEDIGSEGRARDMRGVRDAMDNHEDPYDTLDGELDSLSDDVDTTTTEDQGPAA